MATPTPNYFKNPIVVAKAVLSAVSSVTATVMVVRLVIRPFVPPEFQGSLFSEIHGFLSRFSNEMTMVIESFSGYAQNDRALSGSPGLLGWQANAIPFDAGIRVTKPTKENQFTLAMDRNLSAGRDVSSWFSCQDKSTRATKVLQGRNLMAEHEVQYFELTFHKRHREIVVNFSVPFSKCI